MPAAPSGQISAVILAGGQSRRMHGCDKAFVELHDRPLIHWVIDRLRPQVGDIFIAANPDDSRYQSLGLELLADPLGPNFGPLAGILACLERADSPYILTAPCDTPYLPGTLATRLYDHLLQTGARAVSVSDGTRLHGTLSLLDRGLAGNLRSYLEGGDRQVRGWLASIDSQPVDFSRDSHGFVNINSEADIERVQSMPRPVN